VQVAKCYLRQLGLKLVYFGKNKVVTEVGKYYFEKSKAKQIKKNHNFNYKTSTLCHLKNLFFLKTCK